MNPDITSKTLAVRYGNSIIVFLLALLLTQLLWPFIRPNPTPLFFAAILAAYYGGIGPALLISVLSGLAIDYYFIPPFESLILTIPNLVRMGVFITVSSLVSWLNGSRNRLLDEREKLLQQVSAFNKELSQEVAAATKELAAVNDTLFKSQQRLARSERLAVAGQMAAALAHEIGTPLNLISGHLELLSANHPQQADTQRRVQVINLQLEFIVATVKRLLEWSHNKKPAPQLLEVNELVQQVLWLMKPMLDKNLIHIQLYREPELPQIQADRDGLQQVLLNLINNSVEAMPGGGHIDIKTQLNREAGLVEVSIHDSGPGIAPEAAEHLFEPMWTNKPSGSGFGLAIAHEIMTEHEGEISVLASDSRGAAFRLTLPVPGLTSETRF